MEKGSKIVLETEIFTPPTLEAISREHMVDMDFLIEQYELGSKEELEHTPDIELAEAIALHHLNENPNYYIILRKALEEEEADKLEGYYAKGGAITCEQLDENGERKIDMESIDDLTQCVTSLPQTKSMHFDYESNQYTPERRRLHKDIIYNIKKDIVCIESDEPIAILMGGSPASGKSTFLKKYSPYLLNEEILKIDADDIRSKLPEYRGFNATQTHLETKDIVNNLLSDRNIGLPCKFDVIYDGTMNNTKSYIPLINLLKQLGYRVFIVYIDKVDKDIIVKRALERYKKSGRFVPLEVIDDFFDKGTSAMEQLKFMVDGYMIIDGSNTDYKILSQGGMRLPKKRNYSKIGQPIQITSEEIILELKKGGELDPDNETIKNEITHKSGSAGGMLVGNRHSEGGIKAINKSTNQPLEMEGGEVVITRNAVSDDKKREFEGQMLTNRQILSKINEGGGGVSFADGGDIPEYIMVSGKDYKYGGKTMKDSDIVSSCGCQHKMKDGGEVYNPKNIKVGDYVEYQKWYYNWVYTIRGKVLEIIKGTSYIPNTESLLKDSKAKILIESKFGQNGALPHQKTTMIELGKLNKLTKDGKLASNLTMKEGGYTEDGITIDEYMHLKYGHKLQKGGELLIMNKAVPSFISFSKMNESLNPSQFKETYKNLLQRDYEINFDELPHTIKGALMIGNQKMIDKYINQ
jgi:predicted ABC-type ATPase